MNRTSSPDVLKAFKSIAVLFWLSAYEKVLTMIKDTDLRPSVNLWEIRMRLCDRGAKARRRFQ